MNTNPTLDKRILKALSEISNTPKSYINLTHLIHQFTELIYTKNQVRSSLRHLEDFGRIFIAPTGDTFITSLGENFLNRGRR